MFQAECQDCHKAVETSWQVDKSKEYLVCMSCSLKY